MSSYQPALPNVPRYTRWDQVPIGLFTRTQLGQMDPPRKPAKDAAPSGQVLYHGNSYAPLYALADTVVKRRPTSAQREALARAQQLRLICRLCGGQDMDEFGNPQQLGKGRICGACHETRRGYRRHQDAHNRARALHDQVLAGRAVLLAVDDLDRPRQLALIAAGHHLSVVLTDVPAINADAFEKVTGWLNDLHIDLEVVVCWESEYKVRPRLRELLACDMPNPAPFDYRDTEAIAQREAFRTAVFERARPHCWLDNDGKTRTWAGLTELFVPFHAKPDPGMALFRPTSRIDDPLATATIAADKADVLGDLLRRFALADPALVHPDAPWLHCPDALTDLDNDRP